MNPRLLQASIVLNLIENRDIFCESAAYISLNNEGSVTCTNVVHKMLRYFEEERKSTRLSKLHNFCFQGNFQKAFKS